jgi:hypothetical protein
MIMSMYAQFMASYAEVGIAVSKLPEKYWCHAFIYQRHKLHILNCQVYFSNVFKYFKVIYIMQDVHVKLNPGLPWKNQQSTKRRIFSAENWNNI